MQSENKLTILHFNDVYDIQTNAKGEGGICNFKKELENYRAKYPDSVTLFSGDAFSPSILTEVKRGRQMVYALNTLKIDYACYGNHEFDLTPQETMQNARNCNFPWLLGNVKYTDTDKILGDGIPYKIFQRNGIKVGIIGVVGGDWLGILTEDYAGELQYEDLIYYSTKLCKKLRNQEKCDMIIALTHMRQPSDRQLAEKVPDIDIVLGGHDHIISQKFINGIPVIKSGSNFLNMSVIQITKKLPQTQQFKPQKQMEQLSLKTNKQFTTHAFQGRRFNFEWIMIKVGIHNDLDVDLKKYVDDIMDEYKKHDRIVGHTEVELQARFFKVRTTETNLGNFIADLCRLFYNSEICLLNSGLIRHDIIIPKGPLSYTTISNIVNDLLVQKLIPGRVIIQILEKGCSSLPDVFSGSFLIVSGISFEYDWKRVPKVGNVMVGKQPIDLDYHYSVALMSYLSKGGDGYSMITQWPYKRQFPDCVQILHLILRFFEATDARQLPNSQQQALNLVYKVLESFKNQNQQEKQYEDFPPLLMKKKTTFSSVAQRISSLRHRFILSPQGQRLVSIKPQTDGRIKCITETEIISEKEIIKQQIIKNQEKTVQNSNTNTKEIIKQQIIKNQEKTVQNSNTNIKLTL